MSKKIKRRLSVSKPTDEKNLAIAPRCLTNAGVTYVAGSAW